jgi:[protein-PII] uridylyltransferase
VRSLLAPGGRLKQVDDRGPDVDGATAEAVHADPAYRSVRVVLGDAGVRVEVTAADRIGLMADVAGALALLRVSVRAAHAWTRAGIATSWWEVDDVGLEAVLVAQRLDAVVSGAVDVAARVGARPSGLPPMVLVRHDASAEATLLEVRTDDRLGVVFLVTRALAALHLTVRSAHLSTFGPQALDVFYVQEPGAGALTDDRAADAAHAVRSALEGELPVPAEH